MNDIRYSELLFLQRVASGSASPFWGYDEPKATAVGLSSTMYAEMVLTLAEELYISFKEETPELFVYRLRGELGSHDAPPSNVVPHHWSNPREGLRNFFRSQHAVDLIITYRGLRRIEELRELLKRDRILDPFGVLLDIRYFHPDLKDALARGHDTPVSVLYADMDKFKPINDNYGHAAGDVVMKAYLETVRDTIGQLGSAYRGRGDEVTALILGQGHEKAVEIADTIRARIAELTCVHNEKPLPKVTASIGVASSPPSPRDPDLQHLADSRNNQAKSTGRNRVVST